MFATKNLGLKSRMERVQNIDQVLDGKLVVSGMTANPRLYDAYSVVLHRGRT